MATDAEMVTALKTALATGAAVVDVSIDGIGTRFDRAQALHELGFWESRVARAAGTRPRVASIDLGGSW